ncbi:hypothetical protein PR202_gb11535 [Eleusine coracana subsp. coracana]|uniref:Uncharacterized protein n=1 Tax=Eleusine coracana subsp. coracana TaxID=191504 RepID=A0AAV5EMW1_ELECO|nr:hypothetical protein PR202_gb11535 [Eleusine coracana subsp. coracana]
MEVSAGLRQPPAAAAVASLRGHRSVAPLPPRAASPWARLEQAQFITCKRVRAASKSLFCYDKSVPEEDIGKPTGLNLEKKNVGNNSPCSSCEAKGVVLCATCAGSGLYVDSILESQGVIVKVVEELETLCAPNAAAAATHVNPKARSGFSTR